jgi:aminoglycoside phosphotransferase (APT) family kinase protein
VTAGAESEQPGGDLLGWSAIPLLASDATSPFDWLFVTGRSAAWRAQGHLAAARFVPADADYSRRWPLDDQSIGGVVIDGDALARHFDERTFDRALAEAGRVIVSGGEALVVCRSRLVPPRLRAWRDYGRSSRRRWQAAASRAGVSAAVVAFSRIDGSRVVELEPTAEGAGDNLRFASSADRSVLRVSKGAGSRSHLAALVADAGRASGLTLRIERVVVRKIGKTALFVSDGNRRYILRVTRSPLALSRASRNVEALQALASPMTPAGVRDRVPVAIASGIHAGYSYSLETRLDGEAGPRPHSHGREQGWEMAAVRFITTLHSATARLAQIDAAAMRRFVHEPVERIARVCATPKAAAVLARVAAACDASLAHGTVPLVRAHGDFTESNCLFDADGALNGVVDWEISTADALPLLDLFQLMPVPGEDETPARWLRFDAWMTLRQRPDSLAVQAGFREYLSAVSVPTGCVPGLVLVQWLTHVADRVAARQDDERWMRVRVWQPLDTMGHLLP